MELFLQRQQIVPPLSLLGELLGDDGHLAWTLENSEKAIPLGRYKITLYDSPHLHAIVPLLEDVPGRSMIEIHWGTFPQNYKGCIGVGESRDLETGEIFNTRLMWTKLMPMIEAAVQTDGCWITVLQSGNDATYVQDVLTAL
jgi:hypothetical protein